MLRNHYVKIFILDEEIKCLVWAGTKRCMPGTNVFIVNPEKNSDMNSGFTDSSQGSNTSKSKLLLYRKNYVLSCIQIVSLENYNLKEVLFLSL